MTSTSRAIVLGLGATLIAGGFLLAPAGGAEAYDGGYTLVREHRTKPVVRDRRTTATKPKDEGRREYPSSY